MRTDIEYAKRGTLSLTLDAYAPDQPGLHPAAIIVHGGGFSKGDKQTYVKPLFPVLSGAGFAWFSINYRLAPSNHFPDPAKDVEDAVQWVLMHSKEFRVDPTRVALIGESAGGHLVSYVGATAGRGLAAVVPFYAPHDLLGRAEKANGINENIQGFLGVGPELTPKSVDLLRRASPYYQVHKGMPPYLLIHGTADKQVDYEQSANMQKKLRMAGGTCDLFTVEGGGHGMGSWENLNTAWKNYLVQWLRQQMRTAPSRPLTTGL